MTKVTHERVGGDDHRRQHLPAEEAPVAGDEAVGPGRVDRLEREHAEQDRAEDAADAVARPHVEGVVPLHLLLKTTAK